MARHLWQDDIEQRIAIRLAKDQAPATTVKDLQQRFDVSGNIIGVALEKSVAEWQSILASTPARTTYQPRKVSPANTMAIIKEASSSQVPKSTTCEAPCWEYRTIIVRGRAVLGDIVYEQQGKNGGDWKPIAAKTFDGVLNSFAADRWELASMIVLSHGAAAFTGLYELAFKRPFG